MSLRHRRYSLALIAGGLLLVAGCAAKRVVLVPAPTATIAQNGAAEGQADGVTILVKPNAWNGTPADLPDHVTPVKVTIRNHSGRPLRIEYKDFALIGPNEQRYAAVPPTNIQGSEYASAASPGQDSAQVILAAYREPQKKGAPAAATPVPHAAPHAAVVIAPDFDWDDYYVAPYWGFSYPGIALWPYAWAPDYGYYNGYYPYVQRIHLPTQSMLRKAIPAGVVANGGYVSGFLYFEKVKFKDTTEPVSFTARLLDANTGQPFGTMTIPFEAKKSSE